MTFNNKIIADGTRALIPYLYIAISWMLYHQRRYYGGISGVFIIINCPNNRYWPIHFQINNAWIYNWNISHKFSNSWLTIAKESARHSTTTSAEDFVTHAIFKVYLVFSKCASTEMWLYSLPNDYILLTRFIKENGQNV